MADSAAAAVPGPRCKGLVLHGSRGGRATQSWPAWCGEQQEASSNKCIATSNKCLTSSNVQEAIRNKCHASRNKCLTSSNKKLLEIIKLLGTSASLLVAVFSGAVRTPSDDGGQDSPHVGQKCKGL